MRLNKTYFMITILMVFAFMFAGCGILPGPAPEKGTISGTVMVPPGGASNDRFSKDITGWVPAGGAMVSIVDANGVTHTVEADEDGHYVFENIAVSANTVITATVTVDGKKVILKDVVDKAVSEGEDYDAGTMTPESTALALVVEAMIKEGISPQAINLAAIQANEDFAALADEVADVLEAGGNVTESGTITNMAGNVADEVINPPTPPEPTPPKPGIPVSAISVEGVPIVGEMLTVKTTPSGAAATGEYQWLISDTEEGAYGEIAGATISTYTPVDSDTDKYIKVKITGRGNYRGTVYSDPVEVKYPTLAQYLESNTTVIGEYSLNENVVLVDPVVGANKTVALNENWIDIGGEINTGGFTITSTGEGTVMFGKGFSITGASLGDIIIVNTGGAASYELATGATIPNGYEWQPVDVGRPIKFVMLPIKYNTTNGEFGYSNTINEAITSVIADGTIWVSDGTYTTEVNQIVIDKNLSIIGMDKNTTIIKPEQDTGGPTDGDNRGWFLVESGVEFNLNNVTLDGENQNIFAAVYSHGGGTIENNIFKNIVYPNYQGWVIAIRDEHAMTIKNNEFIGKARIGVRVWNSNGTQIISNTFTGSGDGDYLQYGIEVNGATQNTLINGNDFSYYGTSTTSWGSGAIFVNDAFNDGMTSVTITNNTITHNEAGIYHGSNRSWEEILDVEITGNQLTDNGRHVVDISNDTSSPYVLDLDAVLSDNTFPDGKAQVVGNTIRDVD